jgi:hypothetical protein
VIEELLENSQQSDKAKRIKEVKKEILQKGKEKVKVADKLRYISRIDNGKLACLVALPSGSHEFDYFLK